ncbi:MAG: hypothetical protein RIF32_17265 [Leptospirales bacterium]
MGKWKYSVIFFPTLLVLGLTGVALFQATGYAERLADYALFRGRIVLSSGDLVFPADDPGTNGEAAAVLDGDPDRAAILRFPAEHPHGTFLLIDTALTHSPGTTAEAPPRPRRAVSLRIFNGVCLRCDPKRFTEYGRIKRARLEILYRRANNPDEEFVIPEARPVLERVLEFPDRPGGFTVSLEDLPAPPPSSGWPENMSYMITHIQVLEIYPGTRFADRFAVGEVVYRDRPAPDGAPFAYQKIGSE